MIDLHVHTNYSDGTWDLKKLLEEAEKAKIEVLSITDHDTVKVYKELEKIDYKKVYSGKILSGVEFNTVYDGVAFHLLAYDFDYRKLVPWIYENYEIKKPNLQKEFEYMVQSCKKNHIKIGNLFYDKEKGWPIDVIFSEIKKYEDNKKFFKKTEWNNIDIFFNSCITNKNFPVFVDFSIHYSSADKVAKAVRNAGGKLFIAHIYRYNLEQPIKFLDLLRIDKIIDGVEVEHSNFTNEQSSILKEYCRYHRLLMSGGTDCHGEKKIDRKIGIGYGNMNISKHILDEWKL